MIDPTRCSGCCPPFALKDRLLKSWPEQQMRIMQLAREGSPPLGLRLPQAELSRKSNQIARRRIRRFESYMPSQTVGVSVGRSQRPANSWSRCVEAPPHGRAAARHAAGCSPISSRSNWAKERSTLSGGHHRKAVIVVVAIDGPMAEQQARGYFDALKRKAECAAGDRMSGTMLPTQRRCPYAQDNCTTCTGSV